MSWSCMQKNIKITTRSNELYNKNQDDTNNKNEKKV